MAVYLQRRKNEGEKGRRTRIPRAARSAGAIFFSLQNATECRRKYYEGNRSKNAFPRFIAPRRGIVLARLRRLEERENLTAECRADGRRCFIVVLLLALPCQRFLMIPHGAGDCFTMMRATCIVTRGNGDYLNCDYRGKRQKQCEVLYACRNGILSRRWINAVLQKRYMK